MDVVDLTPLLSYAIEMLGALLLAVGTWAVAWLGRKLKLDADAEVRRYLQDALDRGVHWALSAALDRGQDIARIEVKNEIVRAAAGYVSDNVPDALKRLGVTPDKLRTIVTARLP